MAAKDMVLCHFFYLGVFQAGSLTISANSANAIGCHVRMEN